LARSLKPIVRAFILVEDFAYFYTILSGLPSPRSTRAGDL
jgi:hypothetical protein